MNFFLLTWKKYTIKFSLKNGDWKGMPFIFRNSQLWNGIAREINSLRKSEGIIIKQSPLTKYDKWVGKFEHFPLWMKLINGVR